MPTLKDLKQSRKRFTNGHKTFTASEMEALHELLHHEETRRNRFNKLKNEMKKARNPIIGEKTPRFDEGEGEWIIQPAHRDTKTFVINPQKPVTDKVGRREESEPNTEDIRSIERLNSLKKKRNDMNTKINYLSNLSTERMLKVALSQNKILKKKEALLTQDF